MTADILDIAVVAVVLISGALALARGFVREVLSVGAWVGAAVATLYLFEFAQPVARTYIKVELIADIAAGVALFVVTLIALSLISHALSRRIRESALGPVDRSLGLVFGLARGAAVVALAYLIFAALFPPEDRPAWVTEARTEPLMQEGATALAAVLPERWVAQSVDAAEGAADHALEAGKAVQPLAEPLFKAPTIETKAAEPGDPGYKDQERKDLERLIQSSQ